ncbi:MAG: hypothetical protein K0R54_161 [Clostridiaceae bacterium]|jgi:hypothetical protein|nr:hypothetical protein [Clostridiaceae bacterium]
MKPKIFELKGTKVVIEDNAKCPIINIETTNADIFINGVCIWSKYDKEEYKNIPSVMKEYIADNNSFIEENDDGETTVDVDLNDDIVTFYFPKNNRKKITARVDFFNSLDEIESVYIRETESIDKETADKIMVELRNDFNEIMELSKKYKFDFVFSHSMGEKHYGWWDIKFTIKDWNEDNLKKFHSKISSLDKKVDNYLDSK